MTDDIVKDMLRKVERREQESSAKMNGLTDQEIYGLTIEQLRDFNANMRLNRINVSMMNAYPVVNK